MFTYACFKSEDGFSNIIAPALGYQQINHACGGTIHKMFRENPHPVSQVLAYDVAGATKRVLYPATPLCGNQYEVALGRGLLGSHSICK